MAKHKIYFNDKRWVEIYRRYNWILGVAYVAFAWVFTFIFDTDHVLDLGAYICMATIALIFFIFSRNYIFSFLYGEFSEDGQRQISEIKKIEEQEKLLEKQNKRQSRISFDDAAKDIFFGMGLGAGFDLFGDTGGDASGGDAGGL